MFTDTNLHCIFANVSNGIFSSKVTHEQTRAHTPAHPPNPCDLTSEGKWAAVWGGYG